MTEKLYENDSYINKFEAQVISCEKDKDYYKILLDRTAFFPEGGGQPADIGFIDDIPVKDVQISQGEIYHYTSDCLKPGQTVCGKIDFNRRFAFMQNHTGEHIVSGITHSLYGFDNVGFHLNEELVTLDFNGFLSREQLDDIEKRANEKVWQNLSVKAYYPPKEQLDGINYRSKKEISGDIRIVEIESTDICACCAPHVSSTGQIGIIKLLDTERMRAGIRIIMKCGGYALDDYGNKYKNVYEISKMLSAKQENTAFAVDELLKKLSQEKRENSVLKRQVAEYKIANSDQSSGCIFEENLEIKELIFLADKMYKLYGSIRGAFSKNDKGYNFAICGDEERLKLFFAEFKEKFDVSGGGRGTMVQGTVKASKEEIKMCF